MEGGKVRIVVLLEVSFLWISAMGLRGLSASNNVTDLLAALNMSQHRSGVSRLQSPNSVMYKIRSRAPYLTLPQEYSHFLHSAFQGNMGVHFVGRQASGSNATILSLSSASSPILQILSSTVSNTLRINYQANGTPPVSVLYPATNPLSRGEWVHLAVSLEPDKVVFFVDCQEAAVLSFRNESRIKLEIPQDVIIALGSTPGKKDNKFNGYVKTAELSLQAFERRPWSCDNITDDLPASQNTDIHGPTVQTNTSQKLHPDSPSSKRQTNHQLQQQTHYYPKDVQSDQRQRGAVLGPPGSPQGAKSASEELINDWLSMLEKKMEEMYQSLDTLKAQNLKLQTRVKYLEGCECVRRGCVWEGQEVQEGQRWHTDLDTICLCSSGKVTCETRTRTGGCEPDCRVHNVSCNTLDGCQTCSCESGNRVCSPPPCPPRDCTPKETGPGDCCQQCRGCTHAGVRYDNGATWRSAESQCDVCSCLEGRVHCEREKCHTACEYPVTPPPDSCCPVCHGGSFIFFVCVFTAHLNGLRRHMVCFCFVDCGVNGYNFPNGAVVPTGNRCQDCICHNGNVVCSDISCPEVFCRNPVHRAGECCPRCEQCEYESEVFADGQTFSSRTDRCLHCQCSAGEVLCERASCPAPGCENPAKQSGECCPTCKDCEYERRVYADGQVFAPVGSGPCLQCRCKAGNVICHEEKCQEVQCANPIKDPRRCCPFCKACVLDGVEYEEGSSWNPDSPCSTCTCVNGEVLCAHTQCPPIHCRHPTKLTGSCCEVCESCTYNHRIYNNGQRFTTPELPCHICMCLYGTVECERQACPSTNCSNPYTPPGECCPQCPHCSFENRVFVDGEAFPNPVSVCEECRCDSGRVDCHQAQCPHPRCNAPLPGTCCQNNCNGCSYAGKEYPNGNEFPHPTDACRTCSCINGNVQCLKRRCQPLPCSNQNLIPGDCCPQCPEPPADCEFEQRFFRHMERFSHPNDNCRSCGCNNGTVQCQRKPCPSAPCTHPITQECCRTCEGCFHDGRERTNGETWEDFADPCSLCVCREGSVQCERKRCPPLNCQNPVQGECCMSCEGCTFQGREYLDGTEFNNDNDPCGVCYCYGGNVVCSRLRCNSDCTHPYKPPGQCCGECQRCFYNGAVLVSGQSIPDPGNPCAECICQSGSVRCTKRPCLNPQCSHPVVDGCGCQVCDGCNFQDTNYADGQVISGGEGGCQDCTCSRGEVSCVQRRCPTVSCPHPSLDGCQCGECSGCNFDGRDCFNGERFQHPDNRCELCSCLNGDVVCDRAPCPSVACRHPVTPPGECCPVCTGRCLHQGEEHPSGSTFTSPSDPCSTCSCVNEVVTCQRRPCPVQCFHPVPSDSCCPDCDSCLYEGVIHAHAHTFTPSYDLCRRCTCVRGTISCVPLACPPTACANPVVRQGQCCPECSECVHNGQRFSDGQSWTASLDRCTVCTCQAGEVRCASPGCPELPCVHQVTDPGSCCPRCRGCVYGGEEHSEGSSWFADSTPCMSCQCVDGVTTCSEVHCLSPCVNFLSVPGECCPVCADCVFEGRVYGPGDSFHPAGDPCQICTCEVMPDGKQHLKCYRKQCSSLVDCPKNYILFSGPDSCCPVCTQPLTNCTSTIIGNEVLATDDPCFTCQCKDLTWTCLQQSCPPLSCPPNEQFTPEDSCCPVCKECVIEGQNRRVKSGASWTDSSDDCVTCTCNLGQIECSIEECSPLVCPNNQQQVKIAGRCCYECQDSMVSCSYQGATYRSYQQWEVDECTSCTCVSGDVHCRTERCPPLTCASDEMPAVAPGLCCPHCIPRPATCITFGDPHYRTFDGRMFHFQGTCTYILTQDCESRDFSIHVTNDDRGRKGVSWTKEVTVFLGDTAVQLLQDWVVKVNGDVVTLPFLMEPYIYIERQTQTVLLNTNIGLKVLWSPRSHLEVSVPGSYKGHTCGLCGNFNNYHHDDLQMPGGRLALLEAEFGNSWRVLNGGQTDDSCRPGVDVNPCNGAGFQTKKGAITRCQVLKSAVFKPCHHVVPPEPWFGACRYDLCACGANSDECLCDTLEAYASQCRAAGVILQWRSASLCAVGCPLERGFVFDECGPPCPVTCFNYDVPLGVIESPCFKPCVPGCQCPAGLILHNNSCIQPEKCPKIIHGSHL
ncbi:kielin/chordin-like protein isoform X3 [Oryzias melastigma]|uniref:kielin/chordin-like protein isoform X3 n=1 Tax=Oryzias melastigma TaxID=30732 RepID=UPI00168D6CFD|nr:kielin/chordin-like protein isoform X3 [Oryzias melastigma]